MEFFDCLECGRHIVRIVDDDGPHICAECSALPSWYKNPRLIRILSPNMKTITNLGANLKYLRLRRNKRLVDVAVAVGVSASFLSLIERGMRYPRLAVLERIADELRVDSMLFREPHDEFVKKVIAQDNS